MRLQTRIWSGSAARPPSRSMQPRELGPRQMTASPYQDPHGQQLRRDGLGNPGRRPAPIPRWQLMTPDFWRFPASCESWRWRSLRGAGLGITVSEEASNAVACQGAKCRGWIRLVGSPAWFERRSRWNSPKQMTLRNKLLNMATLAEEEAEERATHLPNGVEDTAKLVSTRGPGGRTHSEGRGWLLRGHGRGRDRLHCIAGEGSRPPLLAQVNLLRETAATGRLA